MIVALIFTSLHPVAVSGGSMRPTFEPDDRLIVESLSPKLGLLSRGDAIVFPDPRDPAHPVTIKRIIGLPGEIIRVEATQVVVTKPDGTSESFERGTLLGGLEGNSPEPKETKLGPEDYFLMGDNRAESTDSREWGTIQPHEMIGKPIVRLAPFSLLP